MLHLFEYATACLLFGLALWLPGRAIVSAKIFTPPSGYSRLTEIVIGISLWTAAIFILCALGLWNDASLKCLLVLAIGTWIWARPRGRSIARPRQRRPTDAVLRALEGILFVSVVALWLHALSPGVSWDASAYHLTVPRLYNEAGGFREISMNVYSNWPIGTELLYAAAMLGKDYILAKLAHFGFGVLTLGAIMLACRPFRSEAGAVGCALWLSSPVILFEFSIAYIDLAEAFLLTAAVLFMLRAKADPAEAPRALFLSGLCCGGVISCKVSGIAAAGAVGALYLPELVRSIRSGSLRVCVRRFSWCFAAPMIALSIPWAMKSAWYTGNPVYPFLYDTLGGTDWSAMLAARFTEWQRGIGMGREFTDYLLLPMRVMLEPGGAPGEFGDAIGRHWIAIVPFSVAFGLRSPVVRGCLAVSGLFFVFWSFSAQNARFLIPILPLLAIAGAIAIGEAMVRFCRSTNQRSVRNAVVAACSAALIWTHLGSWTNAFKFAVLYQVRLAELEKASIDPVYDFIDRALPPDARLVMLNTNQGFHCHREFLADSFFEASQVTAWLGSGSSRDEILKRLRHRGISHVLRSNQDWGFEYPPALLQLLDDERASSRVFHQGEFEIFSLH